MTKDSRRSSVAGPTPHSPQETEYEGSKDGTIPVSASDGLGTTPNSEIKDDVAPELQPTPNPTSDSNPSAVHPSSIDNSTLIQGPATYGTRSRNRVGASRPNYAEDKEIDADFETVVSKDSTERKANRLVDISNSTDVNPAPSSTRRRPSNELELGVLKPLNHYKDVEHGTSALPTSNGVSSTVPVAKKRKVTSQQPASSSTGPSLHALNNASTASPMANTKTHVGPQLVPGFRETNMLGFEKCGGRLKKGVLIADDGTRLEVNDHVYLICEPPGEPYYLGRIMEFLHANNDSMQPIDALRLNWYYRPKDIGRQVNDTRQVFASMHSDISPLTALRGKCQIKHKSEVEKLDDLRRSKDSFWYEKLYDRYIHRFYDVVPTSQVINVPVEVKKVLDERWRFIIVEPGRGKELTSAVKSCKRCSKYCASNDSVDCAVCQNTYHMSCVSPPLLKKPSRGFAWACGPCSKAQEKKLEARNTPNTTESSLEIDEEINDDVESPSAVTGSADTDHTNPTSPADMDVAFNPGTAEQIHQASLWLFRYLGMHCKVEDALDYDDRIYPRASSRLGPRHQAIVPQWHGRPVEYIKPVEIKKRFLKGGPHKKDAKLSKDTLAALEADKTARESRPKWVMDEPPGYTPRGEDYGNDDERNTAKLLYRHPEAHDIPGHPDNVVGVEEQVRDQLVFGFMSRVAQQAQALNLPKFSTNLLDVALETLHAHAFDDDQAIKALMAMDRKAFKEPDLTSTELKKFEDGVSKFGSEWYNIKKHVKTMKPKDVVRFYYTWKKTARGKQVWGNYSGRKNKKEVKRAEVTVGKLQDDVADEHDDSAFDNDKAFARRRGFQCKFCTTRSSRQWRRAPNTPAGTMIPENPNTKTTGKDKGPQLMVALCRRCAELWRRYAIQWEDIEEIKKLAQAGGRGFKRKLDEELLNELTAANEVINHPPGAAFAPVPLGNNPPASGSQPVEMPKKKGKAPTESITLEIPTDPAIMQKKNIATEKLLPPPPPVPKMPRPKTLPCAICNEVEPLADQHLTCKECRLSVHRKCYGVVNEIRGSGKWMCDMCSNDKNPQVSIQYNCMLCPVEHTDYDFVIEPSRNTQKKKSEKDRDRERVERETNVKAAEYYQKRQEEMNRPPHPRQPLKRTANNNWVHVTCAVFTPEVRFGNAKALEPSEGIPSIPSARYDEICKACKRNGGACVGCHMCRAPVHVECAHHAGYILGFDIVPVKGSRRDQSNVVKINGESGIMNAAIWCKEHVPTKTIVHHMHDTVDDHGLTALQLYVQTFKQADLALTGTVRKATLIDQSTKAISPAILSQTNLNRRTSTTYTNGTVISGRYTAKVEDVLKSSCDTILSERSCTTCGVRATPRWWPFPALEADVAGVDTQHDLQAVEASGVQKDAACAVWFPESQGVAPAIASIEPDGRQTRLPQSTQLGRESPEVPVGGPVALATAALDRAPTVPGIVSTVYQCHKCHFNHVKKESTPVPAVSPAAEINVDMHSLPVRASSAVPANPFAVTTETSETPARYAWSQPQPYSSNAPNTWHRPSITPQSTINGNHSPHAHYTVMDGGHSLHHYPATLPSLNGQSHMQSTAPPPPHSPHGNGQVTQVPNGYPPSPHRTGPAPLTNSAYTAYAPPRPSSQHVTNGLNSPRALERPFPPDYSPMNHTRHPSYGATPASPSLLRDPYSQNREASPRAAHPNMRSLQSEYPSMNINRVPVAFGAPVGSPPNTLDPRSQARENNGASSDGRISDGRVNGGASASPSLRNLLS